MPYPFAKSVERMGHPPQDDIVVVLEVSCSIFLLSP